MSAIDARPTDLSNLRDVGGLPTDDGRSTRFGVLWRSDAPLEGDTTAGPDGASWPPGAVLDLRNASELPAPHPLAATSALTSLPLIEALAPHVRDQGRTGRVPIDELYVLLLETARDWLPQTMSLAAHGPSPLLVHCAAGKDRTGVVVAVLLRVAGVTRDAVAADFVATNGFRRPLHDRLVAQGALEPMDDPESVGVVPAHLDAVLDVLDVDPAGLARRAGVPDADLAAWRDRLLGAV